MLVSHRSICSGFTFTLNQIAVHRAIMIDATIGRRHRRRFVSIFFTGSTLNSVYHYQVKNGRKKKNEEEKMVRPSDRRAEENRWRLPILRTTYNIFSS